MGTAVRLRDLGTTYGGLTGKTKSDFGQGSASFVTFMEVLNNTRLRGTKLERVEVKKGERQNRIMRGDLLFNGSSETPEEVALSAVVDFDPNTSTYLNSFCFGYRLRQGGLADATYLAYYFRSSAGRRLISHLAQGATRYNIAKTKFLDVEIDLPSLKRQQEIVEVLTDADNLIVTLKQLIAKRQSIKQGMVQEILTGKFRLPGFTEPWRETRLGSLGQCIRGVSYDPRVDLSNGDRPFTLRLLRSNNVQGGSIDLNDLQFVHERRTKPQQILKAGDIVICMANGSRSLVGKSALFNQPVDGPLYTFGAFMAAYRTFPVEADSVYIAELLSTKAFRDWLDVTLAGSSINNLRPSHVEGFVTLIPKIQEQKAISLVLAEVNGEIALLNKRLTKAQQIKQGMMQELLTDRILPPIKEATA